MVKDSEPTRAPLRLALALAVTSPGAAHAQDSTLAITADRLVDVAAGKVVTPGVVVVRGGRIIAAGDKQSVAIPASARVIELGDATLLPGFIDAQSISCSPVRHGQTPRRRSAPASRRCRTSVPSATRTSGSGIQSTKA